MLVHAVADDDAVGRSAVLDLHHGPDVRLVREVGALRDDAVAADALEVGEPRRRFVRICGLRGVVETRTAFRRRFRRRLRDRDVEQLRELRLSFMQRHVAHVRRVDSDEIEGHERRRRLLGEPVHA